MILTDKIIIIALAIDGISDYITRNSVTLIYQVTWIILAIVNRNPYYLLFFFSTFFTKDIEQLGGGDMDAMLLILFGSGFAIGIRSIFIACIFSVFYYLILNKICHNKKSAQQIPFIYMLFWGFAISFS